MLRLAAVVTLVACATPAPPPPKQPTQPVWAAPAIPAIDPATCEATLRERFEIDVSAEPRACVPLYEAVATLDRPLLKYMRNLRVARVERGPCGDRCPDIASELVSDAALAYYAWNTHELRLTDAAFGELRWRGGTPAPEAVTAYLAALHIGWPELVERVRALRGAHLPPGALPVGDARVFEQIVARGPSVLLDADAISLRDLIRHELGHVSQLRGLELELWGHALGWRVRTSNELADGFIGGSYTPEQMIVASRLLLRLPRGDDTNYVPGPGTPTGYAAFDPMEDFGESVRLAQTDPVRLGTASPIRLMIAAAGRTSLRDPALRRFVAPGLRGLFAAPVGAFDLMAILRLHGETLVPELREFADARPIAWPDDISIAEQQAYGLDRLVATIGGVVVRPSDTQIADLAAEIRQLRAFDDGLKAP